MKQLCAYGFLVIILVLSSCGADRGADGDADGPLDSIDGSFDAGPEALSSDQGSGALDSDSSSGLPESPNEIEFLLQNHTQEVITIKMHGETITPGWFEVLHDDQSLNLFEQCSLCACDSEAPDNECDQCPDLEPNYSEVNPGGLVSRYWSGTVFPVEQSRGEICERQGVVPYNELVARLCWWAGPKEIAPDADMTCVDITFNAWEEIQVIHQVK